LNFKASASTNSNAPPQSLIKKLCYPHIHNFTTAATRWVNFTCLRLYIHKCITWGCEHERTAYCTYKDTTIKNHEDFEIRDAGLYVDVSVPYLHAYLDGIITCKCHGMGVLEIKCPYCFKEQLPQEATEDSGFCLEQQMISGN